MKNNPTNLHLLSNRLRNQSQAGPLWIGYDLYSNPIPICRTSAVREQEQG